MNRFLSFCRVNEVFPVDLYVRTYFYGCENLFMRLASLGMMGAQIRAPLKPLNVIECCDGPRDFKWASMMPRDANQGKKRREKKTIIYNASDLLHRSGNFGNQLNLLSGMATEWLSSFRDLS